MRQIAGLWIDHRKAVIVFVTEKGMKVKLVTSNFEKQLRRTGDSPLKGSHESLTVPADDIRQRKMTHDLGTYYKEVVDVLRESDSILIFGPGEAKGELKKQLLRDRLGDRILRIEAADKMTDHQIAAEVRKSFHP